MKNGIKLLLLITALSVLFSACASSVPEIVPDYENLGEELTDFGGYEFLLAQESNAEEGMLYYYTPDSLYYDMFVEHIRNIEKQHNLKLDFTMGFGNEGTFRNTIFNSFVSGIHVCDFVLMRGSNNNAGMARAGAFVALNNYPDIIDLKNSDKFGPLNILECCMAKGNVYGVVPCYWPLRANDGNMGVFVAINENLIARYGLDDPRDLYEQNEWKLSKFGEIMPVYHQNDGTNDVKALIGNSRYLARGFCCAYKIGNVYENNGNYYPSDKNPDLLSAIEWGNAFITDYSNDYTFLDGWDYSTNLANGESVLAFSESSYLINLAAILDNFGIVPFPVADKYDSKDATMAFSTYPTLSIFAGVNDPEMCAKLIDILFEQIDGASKEEMVDFLYRTMFFDERDAKLYTELYKNAEYDYFGLGGNIVQKIETIYVNKSAQQVISSIDGVLDKIFEEDMLPNYLAVQQMNGN